MSLKAKIEAVLYMTDKPLRAQAIAGIVGEDLQTVRQALLDLIHEYEERTGGLEIADENGYSFQVKDQYAGLMDEFLPIEMSAAQLRTLSAIAIKQPISQSEIIRVRGAGAYDHIRELVQRGFVSKREDEKGRSPLLSTTKFFQEYFRLTKDGKSLRQYLKREMKKKDKEDEALPEPPADTNQMLNSKNSMGADLHSGAQEIQMAFDPQADTDLAAVVAEIPADTDLAAAVAEIPADTDLAAAVAKIPADTDLAAAVAKIPADNDLAAAVAEVPADTDLANVVAEISDDDEQTAAADDGEEQKLSFEPGDDKIDMFVPVVPEVLQGTGSNHASDLLDSLTNEIQG